jgi:thioredoxin 1
VVVKALFFTGAGCAACKKMYPTIDQLKAEGFTIETIDVNQKFEIARKYGVTTLPTIVVLRDDKEIKRHVGIISTETLRTSLKPGTPDYNIW